MKDSLINSLRRVKRRALLRAKETVLGVSNADIGLIVIGCQKGGTTSLYHYLSKHPDVDVPVNKEINYFNSLAETPASLDDYQKSFPVRIGRDEAFTSIDVSPSYMLDANIVSERIHSIKPKAKIVVILREPVSRAISAWFMYKKLYMKNPDWFIESPWVKNNTAKKIIGRKEKFGEDFENDIREELVALENGHRIEYPIVEFGFYKSQLKYYIDIFGRDNILILSSHCLKTKTQNCLDQVTSFTGLPSHALQKSDLIPHFVGDNKHEVTGPYLRTLTDYYSKHNKGLENIVGDNFEWGKVAP